MRESGELQVQQEPALLCFADSVKIVIRGDVDDLEQLATQLLTRPSRRNVVRITGNDDILHSQSGGEREEQSDGALGKTVTAAIGVDKVADVAIEQQQVFVNSYTQDDCSNRGVEFLNYDIEVVGGDFGTSCLGGQPADEAQDQFVFIVTCQLQALAGDVAGAHAFGRLLDGGGRLGSDDGCPFPNAPRLNETVSDIRIGVRKGLCRIGGIGGEKQDG